MVSQHRHLPKALKLPLQNNSSPIFPSDAFSPIDASFNIPENELINSGSISLSIILAEPVIYLRGFNSQEYLERLPSLLRGTLVVRVNKPSKIRSISLTFKGTAKTEWPEGIPPKKSENVETKDVHSHTWPFFNAMFPTPDFSSGANMVRNYKGHHKNSLSLDTTALALANVTSALSPTSPNPITPCRLPDTSDQRRKSHRRTFSTPSNSAESPRGVRALAGKLRREASPSLSPSRREPIFGSLSLGPRRSMSRDESVESENQSKGYKTFEAGEYFYNFELPIPQSLPESLKNTFGSVSYALEASIERPGTFRSKISGSQPVTFVRCPSDNNIEANEPIAIIKPWEDQLHYEIIISGKAFPIGTQVPISFKLTPLAKIELHRIRVYITETSEYYCRNKKVHRVEPAKKFLLQEKLSEEGLAGNLLMELGGEEGVTELEIAPTIPRLFVRRKDMLHPFSTYENIKIHHWIKIVLRISRSDPDPAAEPGKKKHYEISIDSPIHLLDPRCTNANVSLPAYNRFDFIDNGIAIQPVPNSPGIQVTDYDLQQRALQQMSFQRKPTFAPPPFEAHETGSHFVMTRAASQDEPPEYDSIVTHDTNYGERSSTYHARNRSLSSASQFGLDPVMEMRPARSTASLKTTNTSTTTSSSASGHSVSTQDTGSLSSVPLNAQNSTPAYSQQVLTRSVSTSESESASASDRAALSRNPSIMRLQSNLQRSTTSVDIVDQSSKPSKVVQEPAPQSSTFTPISLKSLNLDKTSFDSSVFAATPSMSRGTSTDELSSVTDYRAKVPDYSLDLVPLLNSTTHLRPHSSGSVSIKSDFQLRHSRGPLDSSADIGLHGGDLDHEDDQESMTSTPSLWI